MRISKYIFGFDDSYFKFLCSEFRYWGNIFMKSLKKQLWRVHMFFSIIDLTLKKVVFELLPFKIYCHTFFLSEVGRQLINVTSATGFLLMTVIWALKLIGLSQLLLMTLKTPISHIWWTKLKLIGWSLTYTMLSEISRIVMGKILVKYFLKLQTICLDCMLCLCKFISRVFSTWWNR